jgi:hypothetical protein
MATRRKPAVPAAPAAPAAEAAPAAPASGKSPASEPAMAPADARADQPCIVHLRVCPDAFKRPEDIMQERLLEGVDEPRAPDTPVVKVGLPAVFRSVRLWPESTDIKCWVCDRSFNGPPRFVPTYVEERPATCDPEARTDEAAFVRTPGESAPPGADPSGAILEVGVLGCFCTFGHAATYINQAWPPEGFLVENERKHRNLRYVCEIITGVYPQYITPGDPKTEMTDYGGSKSLEDYYAKLYANEPMRDKSLHTPGAIIPERLRPVRVPLGGQSLAEAYSAIGRSPPAMPGGVAPDGGAPDDLSSLLDGLNGLDGTAAGCPGGVGATEVGAENGQDRAGVDRASGPGASSTGHTRCSSPSDDIDQLLADLDGL